MKTCLTLCIFLLFTLAGCQPRDTNTTPVSTTDKPSFKPPQEVNRQMKEDKHLTMTGTVRYFDMEGGFYGIVTDKGLKLLPMGLEKKYMVDGTIISFNGEFVKGMVTIQQWGQVFKVKSVKLIKMGKSNRTDT
jgi:hypothetical protein